MQRRNPILVITASLLAILLFTGAFPFHKKKYETPISKDTLQPDKVLFDRSIKNIEKGNYEVARLTLNTLINTYDTSEFLAKAKLAIADSWYREGGAHGLAQAEAEYKDFILFYPNMEEAAQSQYKVCEIHYKQMEKADRDAAQATRAEDECRQVLNQFPNSKFADPAKLKLLQVQEVLADKEYLAGDFYHHKGSFPAAASRFTYVTSQYPLYSGSDQALWQLADSYRKMGDRFEGQEADALTKIVKEYPLSQHVDSAKERLTALKRAVPQADSAAYARQKYELENRSKQGMVSKAIGIITGHPDTSLAAKSGTPAMTTMRPSVPVSVPVVAAGGATGISDVVGNAVVGNTDTLDKGKDARMSTQNGVVGKSAGGTGENPASVGANGQGATPAATAEAAPPPTNHPATAQQIKEYQKAQAKAAKKAASAAKKGKPGATPPPTPAATATPTVPGTQGAPGSTTAPAAPPATGTTAPPQQQ
ncbi:MAG: outer membrane protein assembly factor BamD [Bryobacterales bacterium]|jgi:outer membrane protein assembly factor BamD|nr:outer membrane protein assembly factor BamD [Bryobacterales bacterium]